MEFKKLHPWNLSPAQAINIQHKLKPKIKLKKYYGKPRLIAGVDVAFKRGQAIGAVVVLNYPELKIIEQVRKTSRISYPYIPGLLTPLESPAIYSGVDSKNLVVSRSKIVNPAGQRAKFERGLKPRPVRKASLSNGTRSNFLTEFTFREGPVLEKCLRALKSRPGVIIFDGQGIAHPRNMGIATHMGILLDKSTIGCAKSRLWGSYVEPAKLRGAFTSLFDRERKKIGAVLRTKDFVKPLFVSVGYKMDMRSALRIILQCTKKYRICEPLRLAHQLTRQG